MIFILIISLFFINNKEDPKTKVNLSQDLNKIKRIMTRKILKHNKDAYIRVTHTEIFLTIDIKL